MEHIDKLIDAGTYICNVLDQPVRRIGAIARRRWGGGCDCIDGIKMSVIKKLKAR